MVRMPTTPASKATTSSATSPKKTGAAILRRHNGDARTLVSVVCSFCLTGTAGGFGFGFSTVGAAAAVYLKVTKEVALEQEEKAKDRLAKAQETVRRQKAIVNAPGWKEKVRPEVQETENKKLRDAEVEAALIEEQIRELEKLRLEV